MPVICISSPQGGSGKTTLAANLASAYAYRGNKVLLIDLNVQNALRHYFNLTLVGPHGFVPYIDNTDDWGQFILKVDTNLYLLPYGDVTWKQHLDFQMLIHEKPDVFRKNISDITAKSGVVVIIFHLKEDFAETSTVEIGFIHAFAHQFHIALCA